MKKFAVVFVVILVAISFYDNDVSVAETLPVKELSLIHI